MCSSLSMKIFCRLEVYITLRKMLNCQFGHIFFSLFVIHARAGLQSVHWLTCLVSRQIQYQFHDDLMKRKEELVSCNKMFLFYVRKFRYKGYFQTSLSTVESIKCITKTSHVDSKYFCLYLLLFHSTYMFPCSKQQFTRNNLYTIYLMVRSMYHIRNAF